MGTVVSREQLAYWAESETQLLALLGHCAPYLTVEQRQNVQECIDHNEHGVAAELLFDYLADEPRRYPDDLIFTFEQVALRLPLSGNRMVKTLRRRGGYGHSSHT